MRKKIQLKNSLGLLIVLLAASASVYGQIAEQNLCEATPVNGLIFVNDPALCNGYLWCNVNSSGALVSVHQGTCPTDFNFSKILS